MKLSEAFAPGVTPEQHFLEMAPRLYESRKEQYAEFSSATLILSFRYTDTDERYALRLSPKGMKAQRGDFIDFPVLSVEGPGANWERTKRHLLALLESADKRVDHYKGKFHLTPQMVEDFERFDGTIDIEVTEMDDGKPLPFRVILNDYEAVDGAPNARIEVPLPLLRSVVEGHLKPAEAAKQLKVKGAVSFAIDLGGFLLKCIER